MKILLFILLLYSAVAIADQGDIVKCVQSDGSVVYTNTGCDAGRGVVVSLKPLTIVEPETQGIDVLKNIPAFSFPMIGAIYLLMSVLCFLAYWWDKRKSVKGEWRISEANLHWLEFLGGWPGAFIAQRKLRHKNRKQSYQIVFWLIVGIHLVAWTDYLFLNHRLWNFIA